MGMDGINDDGNVRRYIGMGARFITSGNDHSFIVAGSIERAKFYREPAVEAAGKRTGAERKRADHVLESARGIVKQLVGGAALGVSVRTSIRRSHVNAFKCIEWST
jgi:hypothetical protein